MLAQAIIAFVGGEKNIVGFTSCMTRLRFSLKDEKKPDVEKLKKLEDVLGVQYQGGQFQIIIGGKVQKVAKELQKLLKLDNNVQGDGTKKGAFSSLLDTLAAILTPALPAIIAGGLLKGFIYMFIIFGWADKTSDTIAIFNIIADCMFYFFPFLLAVSSAKKFQVNEYLALAVAGALMYPTLINAAIAGDKSFFMLFNFIPIAIVQYNSSVIPIILSVLLLKYVANFFNKIIPDMVNIVFAPLLTLCITIPIALFALAPIGYYIGAYLAIGIQAIIGFSPWIGGFVVGATRPFLVLAGMHHAINPIAQQELVTSGYTVLSPMSLMSTMSQATAALGVLLITRDKKMKQTALSAAISGYIGITEPALYGIIIKYKVALWAVFFGGGLGSAVAVGLGGKGYAFVMPGLLSLPSYMGEGFTGILIGIAVAIVSTLTILITFSKKIRNQDELENIEEVQQKSIIPEGEITDIFSPISGELQPLSALSDSTFAKEIVGKGISIIPSSDDVFAPIACEVVMLFPTKHAIGLKTANGIEIMIHIGIDTVNLEGEHFIAHVEQNQKVARGDKLLTFNREALRKKGYDCSVITIITNYQEYLSIIPAEESGLIFADEKLLSVIK